MLAGLLDISTPVAAGADLWAKKNPEGREHKPLGQPSGLLYGVYDSCWNVSTVAASAFFFLVAIDFSDHSFAMAVYFS